MHQRGLASAGFHLCCCFCQHGAASEKGGSLHFVLIVATYTASISRHAQNGAWLSFWSFHSSPFSGPHSCVSKSVGLNPLMNVFFWGFTWQHIPTPGQWTSGWLLQRVFYFILHCQMFMFEKNRFFFFFFVHIRDDVNLKWNEWRHKRKPDRRAKERK